ncbi:hypothetical protein S83_070727, partial [Arachis hypogaea]
MWRRVTLQCDAESIWTQKDQIQAFNPPFDVVFIEESMQPLISAIETLVSEDGVVLLRYQKKKKK